MVRRTLLVVVLALGGVLGAAPRAMACSCAGPPGDVLATIADADGAFVGRLVRTEDPTRGPVVSSGRTVHHHFEVEAVAKGDLGPTVIVDAAASGASCGIEARVGDRLGLVLRRGAGRWTSGLCDRLDPDQLAAVSSAPTGSGTSDTSDGLGRNLVAALVLGLIAVGATAAIDARTRHDPASPKHAGS